MSRPLILLGGPSYRMECDVRHAISMAHLALALRVTHGFDIMFSYVHRTPVAMARNVLFKEALESEAELLFWMDSDCAILRNVAIEIAETVDWSRTCADGLLTTSIIFPTRQRDGRLNIWTGKKPGERWNLSDYRERFDAAQMITPIYAGGFGAVLFNLRWYRKHWPNAPHFFDQVNPDDGGYMSEDFVHCMMVKQAGGKVAGSPFMLEHYHRGGESK